MAWHPFVANLLPEPMLTTCQLNSRDKVHKKLTKKQPFSFKKGHLKASPTIRSEIHFLYIKPGIDISPRSKRPYISHGQLCNMMVHGPLTRYVKFRMAHAPGMPGTFSPPPTSKETASLWSWCAILPIWQEAHGVGFRSKQRLARPALGLGQVKVETIHIIHFLTYTVQLNSRWSMYEWLYPNKTMRCSCYALISDYLYFTYLTYSNTVLLFSRAGSVIRSRNPGILLNSMDFTI